ncbi:Ger(x)C family spore germination protein [Paenibacillus thailandensis]|uniref:Ger(X)C family spore germination protein n=1 Tax=Paenibacillus thailandensis TaxID=393250 RepID=A0ABW5QRX2_9BACL
MRPGHRKRRILLVPLLLLLFAQGCGFKDIDKRFFIVATGIDASGDEDKPYRVTIRLAIPSPQVEPGKSKAEIETIDAPTVAEAMRLLKSHVDKELDFGHCKIFLLGEKLAANGYKEVLEWMMRRRDIQNVADVAVGIPDTEKILHIEPVSERYPGNALFFSFGADGTDSSYIVVKSVSEFSRRAYEKGLDPILPVIKGEKQGYIINQAAVFNKSSMAMMLSPEETQTYLQVAERFSNSSITAKIESKSVVLAVNYIQTRYKFKNSNEIPVLEMNIRARALIDEAPRGMFDQEWGSIEKQISEQYAEQVRRLLVKLQKAGVDPIGFGLNYRANHPGNQAFEEWKKIYPKLKFEIKCDIKIEGTGLIE